MHVLSLFAPCVAPPAAHSRTLQWDTDPSVLQLQADSELGYFLPPFFFLLFLFLNYFFPCSPIHSFCVSIECLSIFPCLAFYLPSFVCPLLGPPTLILLLFKFVGFKCFQLVTLQLFARGCVWHWLIHPHQYRCRQLFSFLSPWLRFFIYFFGIYKLNLKAKMSLLHFIYVLISSRDASISFDE